MTTSNRGSLLALDAFASEESLRVYIYKCAMKFPGRSPRYATMDLVASAFLNFIKGERWRLDALDTALEQTSRCTTVEVVLEKAQAIVDWVQSEPVIPADAKTLDEVTEKPIVRKKAGATKK